jgi:hypothetical protein
MFYCDNCHRITAPKERMFKIPIKYRIKTYYLPNNKKVIGYEIEKEGKFCEQCAPLMKIETPKREIVELNIHRKSLLEILSETPKVPKIEDSDNKPKRPPLKDKWKSPKISMSILRRNYD